MATEVYYYDENGNSVDEAHAHTVYIRELDENGNLIKETTGSFQPPSDENEIFEFTQEEIDEALAEGYELDFSTIRIVDGKGPKL